MGEIERSVMDMSVEECWTLLENNDFGRLAYRLVDEVHLVPINYVAQDRSLYFRTASGSKLLAAALRSDVAFEIDQYDDTTAWSVVARGTLRQLEEDEQHRLDSVAQESWTLTEKPEVIELVADAVTGRRFALGRPHAGTVRQS